MSTEPVPIDNTVEPIDILLVGLGAVGSVYACLLEKSGRARITAVARSNYDILSSTGVTLDTAKYGKIQGWRPYRVVRSQLEALASEKRYAFALVTTKCLLDILPNSELLTDAIRSKQIYAWVLIQNGFGVEEDLYQAVKDEQTPIISSLACMGATTSTDGRVIDWGVGNDVMCSGIYPPLPTPAWTSVHQYREQRQTERQAFTKREISSLNQWVELVRGGDAIYHTTDHIDSITWNCGWSTMEGLIRSTPLEFIPIDAELRSMIKLFFREIVTVDSEAGVLYKGMIQYPTGAIGGDVEDFVNTAYQQVIDFSVNRSGGKGYNISMHVDVEQGRPFEIEVITGSILRLAQKYNVPTPRLEFAYALLKILQGEYVRKQDFNRKEKQEGLISLRSSTS